MAKHFRAYAKPNQAIRQAPVLSEEQFARLVKAARRGMHAKRDVVGIYLAFYCGLRAQEIAGIRWRQNVCDIEGKVRDHLTITADIGKNSTARVIPMPPIMIDALRALRAANPGLNYVFHPIKGHVDKNSKLSASAVSQWFRRFFAEHGFEGCSSHSGRRTFITLAARKAHRSECSIADVQRLAGHRSLDTTAAYIEPSSGQAKMVSGLYDKAAA